MSLSMLELGYAVHRHPESCGICTVCYLKVAAQKEI